MSILDYLLNRRTHTEPVKDDRRDGKMKRLAAASKRVDSASEELCQTISMSRADFLAQSTDPQDKLRIVMGTVDFISFSENCQYRYSPEQSLMKLCKHPDHEACKSGVAPCQPSVCPEYLKASKAK